MATAARQQRITRDDIEAKMRSIVADTGHSVERAKNIGIAIATGAAVVVVVGAYMLGRRRGRRRRTVVEIRRI